MSAEEAKTAPVAETPAAEPTPAPAVETPAVEETKAEEAKPAEEAPAAPAAEAATEAAAEETAEAAKEEAKPIEPKEEGHILYHAPGGFLKEFLPIPPKKVFFWFSEEPVESSQLKAYLAKGKEAAASTAAWASQTGKGLLFFNKHGEDKAAPSGALNLADAEDIKEAGTTEFTFKLHNHKHKFDAQTPAERDSWVLAVKKVAEEAKAKKDEILNSEGYKEALAKLKPAPVAAVTAPKVSEETPKKSMDTPAEGEDAKKAAKSRSRSRGPLGFLKSKKEEAKEEAKGEDKKEETAAESATAAEAAPAVEPTVEGGAAPAAESAPAEEAKEEAAGEAKEAPKEEPKKEGRRLSRFESFFKGKPKEAKKEEKKEEAPVAEEPAKAAEEPATAEETPAAEPAAETAAVEEAPKEEAKEEEKKKEETTPVKEHRKSSFLTGLKGFTQKVRSPSSEHPPAVPAKDDAAEASTDAAAATEAATDAPATEATTAEEPATNGETKTEKRRSSFFNFGTVNKKKAEPAPAADEAAKTEAAEEAAKPAEEEAAATETEKPEASPKEHKESPFASIGRRVSKAIRGGEKPKKEAKAAAAVGETKEETKPEETAAPTATLPEPLKADENVKPAAIGDVVPEAVTVGTAPTVSATA
ncbi:uncharacterized protein PV09_02382 [Verruconis gallopava]|uniref:Meiotic expression up-regulated protein 6 PH domain-containing protein n=1 Tax=Verruconis gallopava TaxID=253628 RepID=A0A0D1Z135_9PEZI|nr:uncharacterized protein PV09_02382 [Verruconis gallopava]KIW06677.1 hypothetical protein PV09_02382 [Verruconis gallopava]